MNDADVIDAPQVDPVKPGFDERWAREFAAFTRLLPELLKTRGGKFAAVHGGQVVAIADPSVEAALTAFQRVGYVPLHVGQVTDTLFPTVRLPSSRVVKSAGLLNV